MSSNLEYRVAPPPPQRCVSSTTISTSSLLPTPTSYPPPPSSTRPGTSHPSHEPPSYSAATANYPASQSASGSYFTMDRSSERGTGEFSRERSPWSHTQPQRPFESAFRSAIERMRLSSESRLEMLGKDPVSFTPSYQNPPGSVTRQDIRVSTTHIPPMSFSSRPDDPTADQGSSATPRATNGVSSVRIAPYARSASSSNFLNGASSASPWDAPDTKPFNDHQNSPHTFSTSKSRQTSTTFLRPSTASQSNTNIWQRLEDIAGTRSYSVSEDTSAFLPDSGGGYDNLEKYSVFKQQGPSSMINETRAASLNMHKPNNFGRFEASTGSSNVTQQSSIKIPIRHQSVSSMNISRDMGSHSMDFPQSTSATVTLGGGSTQSLPRWNTSQQQQQQQGVPKTTPPQPPNDSGNGSMEVKTYGGSQQTAPKFEQRSQSPPRAQLTEFNQDTEKEEAVALPSVKDIIRQVEAITQDVVSTEVGRSFTTGAAASAMGVGSSSSLPPARVMGHHYQEQGSTFVPTPPTRPLPSTPTMSSRTRTTPVNNLPTSSGSTGSVPTQARTSLLQRKSSDPTTTRKPAQLPSDYQRLREAFIEQRNEIQRLRRELLGKEKEVASLQQNLRTCEERLRVLESNGSTHPSKRTIDGFAWS